MILSGGAAGPLVPLTGGAPVLTRCEWNSGLWTDANNHGVSDGIKTWAVGQRRHVVLWDCSALKLVYCAGASYESPQTPVLDCQIPGTITLSATVWKQVGNPNTFGGSPVDMLFAGGSSANMSQGQILVSDATSTLTFKKGDIVWTRTLVTCPSGGKWSVNWPMHTEFGEGYVAGTGSAPDLLHSGTVTVTSPGIAFTPVTSLATLA